MGLLYAPHTSAGRVPTEKGLRLFVDGLLEVGDLEPQERGMIEARMSGSGQRLEDVLTQATSLLSGLSRCAGLVVTAKQDAAAQACRVRPCRSRQGAGDHGQRRRPGGEPRHRHAAGPAGFGPDRKRPTISMPGWPGRTIDTARAEILAELESERAMLDSLTAKIVAEGLATLAEPGGGRTTRC